MGFVFFIFSCTMIRFRFVLLMFIVLEPLFWSCRVFMSRLLFLTLLVNDGWDVLSAFCAVDSSVVCTLLILIHKDLASTSTSPRQIPSKSFQLIIHLPSYHSTLHNTYNKPDKAKKQKNCRTYEMFPIVYFFAILSSLKLFRLGLEQLNSPGRGTILLARPTLGPTQSPIQ
jgi:hypothetical protein